MHQEPDKAKELNNEQGNGGYNSPAIANTSPANAESSSGESPPVDRKDFPANRNNSLISEGNLMDTDLINYVTLVGNLGEYITFPCFAYL